MFDWLEYLQVAKALVDRDDEASHRSALSRSYYAAFHHAQKYLTRSDPDLAIPTHGQAHEVVLRQLNRTNSPRQLKNAGIRLTRLKRLRTWADYDGRSRASLAADLSQAIVDADWIAKNLALDD